MEPSSAAPTGERTQYVRVGGPVLRPRVRPDALFDAANPYIKDDLVRMIAQWCEDEGYYTSMLALQDEANMKMAEVEQYNTSTLVLRQLILDGNLNKACEILKSPPWKRYKALLFAVERQVFLETVAAQEMQKAFSLLNRRLKPLEAYARSAADFKDLCYLLTCKNVQEGIPEWEGAEAGRQSLVEQLHNVLEMDKYRTGSARGMLGSGGGGGGGGGSAVGAGVGANASFAAGCAGGTDGGAAGGLQPGSDASRHVPERRLWALLRQAYAYQVEFSQYHPRLRAGGLSTPAVHSLLEDYACPMLPNAPRATLRGHSADVKAVAYLGREGTYAVSGGSDNTVRVWDCRDDGRAYATLRGHEGRVWAVSAPPSGRTIVSAGGDGVVRLWSSDGDRASGSAESTPRAQSRLAPSLITGPEFRCALVCGDKAHGAVYSAAMSDSERLAVSGGFDRKVRVYDVPAGGKLVSALLGHESAVTSATFNQAGNLVISGAARRVRACSACVARARRALHAARRPCAPVAPHPCPHRPQSAPSRGRGALPRARPVRAGSKDCKVQFWDVRSGLSIKTLSSTLIGEVSSIALSESGLHLVVCSRSNANRLWDVRMLRALATFKGHHNTSANFVRARFGPKDETVVGGSEDGCVYMWDVQSGAVLHRLCGHDAVVYDVDWSERAAQLASCSHDGTVRLWMWEGEEGRAE